MRFGLFWLLCLLLPLNLVSPVNAQTPAPYDSGLTEPFITPSPVTGQTLNLLNYGATINNSADDDAVAIRNALAAASSGDELYLPNGTYHLKTGDIFLKSGVSIRGQSTTGTILSTMYSSSPYAVLYATQGTNNFTLSSFKITLASGVSPKAGIRLGQGNPATNNSTYQYASRIRVTQTFIEKHERFGLQLENAYHVLIENNTIMNATALGDGGQGYGVMIGMDRSHNNWIRNNSIGPVIRHGILLQYRAHHNLVETNTITGTVSDAIDFHGEDEYSNEVRNNTISDCPQNYSSGIGVGEFSGTAGSTTEHDNSGPFNWVHHNEVFNCVYGLRIVNNSNYTYIEDNNFHQNVTAGIQADLAPMNHIYISRNLIQNNPHGIRLTDVTYAQLQGNTISNNTGFGLWTNPGTINYTIVGNTITNNGTNVSLGSPNGYYSNATPTPGTPPPADPDGDGDFDYLDILYYLSRPPLSIYTLNSLNSHF